MSVQRFIIPLSAATPTDAELQCALMWLLQRPEADRHIAFPTVQNIKMFFDRLEKSMGFSGWAQFCDQMRRNRKFTFSDGQILTCAPLKPWVQASPNGACLLAWGDTKQAHDVEKRLGPVGAICVLPYTAPGIATWINANGPTPVNCSGDVADDDVSSLIS